MGLFGGNSGDAPPDIGQEEKYDEKNGLKESGESEEKLEKIKEKETVPQEVAHDVKPVEGVGGVVMSNVQIESINARIDSIVEWIKQFYERFSYVSESIGEIRTMAMNNEKRISEEMKEANRVIDIVNEVRPQELKINYQKADMRMSTLAEKIEANKLFMDEIMKEMNDLRRKSEVFVGTEGLMNLNSDTKKDLIEIQKLASKTRMQTDKAQEIFMELRKGFAESQKVEAIVSSLDESYGGLKDEIEKLKLDHGKIVTRNDFLDFKKTYGNKLALFDANVSDVEKIKQNLNEVGDLIETSLSVSRRNEEDIGKIGMKIGETDVKKVSDYENQIMNIIGIIETLSKQLAEVRKKIGLKEKKTENKIVKKEETKKNIKPSEKEKAVEEAAAVEIAKVPQLKPKEFLGKKNPIVKSGEADLQKVEKKIKETETKLQTKKIENKKVEPIITKPEVADSKIVKPKIAVGKLIKRIATKVRPEIKEKIVKKKRKVKRKRKSKSKRKNKNSKK